jgi:hypothetical protein
MRTSTSTRHGGEKSGGCARWRQTDKGLWKRAKMTAGMQRPRTTMIKLVSCDGIVRGSTCECGITAWEAASSANELVVYVSFATWRGHQCSHDHPPRHGCFFWRC